ncbi:pilus assembly protein [Vibrio sp. T187]|uniref:TadE/TadG family type IV pilus assembly protein n=1 Tax=Vibrio TaxID=662 RepID=UPI0010C9DD43|nr:MULTISPECIES: TadE family protein [Vibrio]MBW3694709.1 pilus assembly protein [Vibrio sp. T187]
MNNIKRQSGVASIEFGLSFFAFFLMCITWAEMGYMSYVSSVSDYAISESVRDAKVVIQENERLGSQATSTQFMYAFKQSIQAQGSLWGEIIDPNKFRLSIQYIKDINELSSYTGSCEIEDDNLFELECGESVDSVMAVYRIDYDFTPMLSLLIDTETLFSREVIVIQEYERDQFKI